MDASGGRAERRVSADTEASLESISPRRSDSMRNCSCTCTNTPSPCADETRLLVDGGGILRRRLGGGSRKRSIMSTSSFTSGRTMRARMKYSTASSPRRVAAWKCACCSIRIGCFGLLALALCAVGRGRRQVCLVPHRASLAQSLDFHSAESSEAPDHRLRILFCRRDEHWAANTRAKIRRLVPGAISRSRITGARGAKDSR